MESFENKTTIEYNDDETELTLLVNAKPLHKYAFVKYKPKPEKIDIYMPCKLCDFYKEFDCAAIKCLWDQRKDMSDGYYKHIENGN